MTFVFGGLMNNVVQLFAPKQAEIGCSEPKNRDLIAVEEVLTFAEQLGQAIKKLSLSFDTMENAIDRVDDMEARTRLRQPIKRSREALSNALLNLTYQMGKCVAYQA